MSLLLKMWHQSLQNLSNRKRIFLKVTLLVSLLTFSILKSEAQPSQKSPGVVESLRFTISQTRDSLKKVITEAQSVERYPSGSQLHPEFVKSILLHSDKSFLHFVSQDICQLVSLVDNDLLKDSLGIVKKIPFFDPNQKLKVIEKAQFVQNMLRGDCSKVRPIRDLYQPQTILKTIQGLNLVAPKTTKQCHEIVSHWKTNSSMPYLCSIPDLFEKGPKIQTYLEKVNVAPSQVVNLKEMLLKYNELNNGLSFFKKSLISNLCENLSQPQKFCFPYLKSDVWSKTLSGEKPQSFLSYSCRELMQKEVTPLRLKTCAGILNQQPSRCHNETTQNFTSLSPKPNCDNVSKALDLSRLITSYKDCPAQIFNTAITNIYRILQHFDFKPQPKNSLNSSCSTHATDRFVEMNNDFNNEEAWPLKICYDDPFLKKNTCLSYIPGSSSNETLSEENVVSKIVKKIKKLNDYPKCKLTPKSKYNPHLLEYKNGCFIIFDPSQCSYSDCSKKLILNEQEVTGLTYVGKVEFDYFMSSYSNQKFSAVNILDELKSIKSTRILNYTQLTSFFKVNPEGIIHGIGCSEDLLPQFFKREQFNQCKPLPFIVDGNTEENKEYYLTLRTSIDDLHHPRLLKWDDVFSAIANYQQYHPFKDWVFYGLKK